MTASMIRIAIASAVIWIALTLSVVASGDDRFGINYGQIANNLPSPADVVSLIKSINVKKAKLYDTNPTVLSAFGGSGISFVVGTANSDLPDLANTQGYALAWVQTHIMPYYPSTNIIGIVVGNEIFAPTADPAEMSVVLPAMRNVYAALVESGLGNQIFVSTAHSFGILSASYPPSAGAFESTVGGYMKPLLQFLADTGAPFLINVYPFFAYKESPATVPLDYVLFESNSTPVVDTATGLVYRNMFDAQMDSVYSAISKLGFSNIRLLVSETGWPSAGDSDEPGANVTNAQTYHANLVRHVTSNSGTPLRPDTPLDVYLFALFNENLKPGPKSERHYGLFWPNGTKVYEFSFLSSSSSSSSSSSAAAASFHPLSISIFFFFLAFSSFVSLQQSSH